MVTFWAFVVPYLVAVKISDKNLIIYLRVIIQQKFIQLADIPKIAINRVLCPNRNYLKIFVSERNKPLKSLFSKRIVKLKFF